MKTEGSFLACPKRGDRWVHGMHQRRDRLALRYLHRSMRETVNRDHLSDRRGGSVIIRVPDSDEGILQWVRSTFCSQLPSLDTIRSMGPDDPEIVNKCMPLSGRWYMNTRIMMFRRYSHSDLCRFDNMVRQHSTVLPQPHENVSPTPLIRIVSPSHSNCYWICTRFPIRTCDTFHHWANRR